MTVTGEKSVQGRVDAGRELIDIKAVAQRLGVSERHMRRLVSERRIPFIKWGHLLRFDPVEIEAWIDAVRRPADTAEHRFPSWAPVRARQTQLKSASTAVGFDGHHPAADRHTLVVGLRDRP
jgi:excisionase family DNA binding protein